MKNRFKDPFKVIWFTHLVCYFFGHSIFQTDPARWQCSRCHKGFWKNR